MKLEFLTASELCTVLQLEDNLTDRERLLLDRLVSALDALDGLQVEYDKLVEAVGDET